MTNEINQSPKEILLASLHQILIWMRLLSSRPHEPEAQSILFHLADISHNWPDWMNGNHFFSIDGFASDIEELAQHDYKCSYWLNAIAPYLHQLAASLRCATSA